MLILSLPLYKHAPLETNPWGKKNLNFGDIWLFYKRTQHNIPFWVFKMQSWYTGICGVSVQFWLPQATLKHTVVHTMWEFPIHMCSGRQALRSYWVSLSSGLAAAFHWNLRVLNLYQGPTVGKGDYMLKPHLWIWRFFLHMPMAFLASVQWTRYTVVLRSCWVAQRDPLWIHFFNSKGLELILLHH